MDGLSAVDLANLSTSLLAVAALVALPFAVAIALALIRLLRGRISRAMARRVGSAAPPDRTPTTLGHPEAGLAIEAICATRERASAARALPALEEVRRRTLIQAAIYAGAAAACALLLAALVVMAADFAPTNLIALKHALLTGLFFLSLATPVVLAPSVVLTRRPSALSFAVLALVAAMWLVGGMTGTDPFGMWLLLASVPTAAVLALSTRRLRAIGPIVYAALLVVLYAFCLGAVGALFVGWHAIGPIRFARDELAQLPLLEAAEGQLNWLRGLPLEQLLAQLARLGSDPSSFVQVANPDGLTTTLELCFNGIWIAMTAAGAAAAWWLVSWIASAYQARRASDQMLAIDVLMLIFTVPLSLIFVSMQEPALAPGALAAFAGYRLLAGWGVRRSWQRGPELVPRTLLLLRVFGFDRRTQRLLEDVGQRWRYLGPVRLIAGADAAYATIEPHEFLDFLAGRLARGFIKSAADLERRVAESSAVPDPDGLFRVQDFFCHDDTWRMTVSRLARDADAVLMDLRGFGPANQGCVFEIEQLTWSVPLRRVVLLVDASTDVPFLERTLREAWRSMPASSPNASTEECRPRLLEASRSNRRTLHSLLGLLCEGFGEPRAAP